MAELSRTPKPTQSRPPWTAEQVDSLNSFQRSGVLHPFTCGACRDRLGIAGDDRLLVATPDGWVCPTCLFTQDWAWQWMADGSWVTTRDQLAELGFNFAETGPTTTPEGTS